MVRPTVFISYKRNDAATAELVDNVERHLAALQIDVLRDTGIEAGDRWSGNLYSWLMTCSAAVAIIGEEPAKSEWCRREWWFLRERQFHDKMPLIPISVDGTHDSGGILSHIQDIKRADAIDETTFASIAKLENLAPSPQSYLAAHHAWLRWQFNEMPMRGREPFSLRDVYVDMECGKLTWGEITDDQEPRDPFTDSEACGGRHDLIATVMDFVLDSQLREPIMVQGPPGSGKSAFSLRLADKLLEKGFAPILVCFRDLRPKEKSNVTELIEDALRIGSRDGEPPRPQPAILDNAMLKLSIKIGDKVLSRTILILDGWDEIPLARTSGYQQQLIEWIIRFREHISRRPGLPIRIIMTGRPSMEVWRNELLSPITPILTLRSLSPEKLFSYALRICKSLNSHGVTSDHASHIDLRRLKPIFNSYERWFNHQDRPNGNIQNMEVMGNPLLAFLTLCTITDRGGEVAEFVRKPTALYRELVQRTVEGACHATEQNLEYTARLSGEELRNLLHQVARIASIKGDEKVTFSELAPFLGGNSKINSRSAVVGFPPALVDEVQFNALLGLIVSFFFRGSASDLGCEFLHKSLREYLFAEYIFNVINDLVDSNVESVLEPGIPFWRDFGEETRQYRASRHMAKLFGPQWLSDEVRTHLFWLIEQEVSKEKKRWILLRDLLLDVYIWWAEGVHLRPQRFRRDGNLDWQPAYAEDVLRRLPSSDTDGSLGLPRSTTIDAHLGEALMELTALVHALLTNEPTVRSSRGGWRSGYRKGGQANRFIPGGGVHAKAIFARINAAGWRKADVFPGGGKLPLVSLSREALQNQVFAQADLCGVDARKANLREANMRGAELQKARLQKANLRGANLSGANLSGANLRGADLRNANLDGARLGEANLTDADLRKATLRQANCRGVQIHTTCRLQFADLSSARYLSQRMVNSAMGNSETKLPPELTRPAHWFDD